MKGVKIESPIKGKSYVDLVLELETCGEGWKDDSAKDKGKHFPIEKDNYFRSLTSGILKAKYPDRIYTVNREMIKGTKVATVRRIK